MTDSIFFFDQPSRRSRTKNTKSIIYHFILANEEEGAASERDEAHERGSEMSIQSNDPEENVSEPPPAVGFASVETEPIKVYMHAAPKLLKEVSRILSVCDWPDTGCVPRGVINILRYSWEELTLGSLLDRKRRKREKKEKAKPVSPSESITKEQPQVRKPDAKLGLDKFVRPDPQRNGKKRPEKGAAITSSSLNFTTPGGTSTTSTTQFLAGVSESRVPSTTEPEWIRMCQWVVARLQASQIGSLDESAQKILLRRHYGDKKTDLKKSLKHIKPVSFVNGAPRIPEIKLTQSTLNKLHYRVTDGSSIVYYPSGRIAICQTISFMSTDTYYINVYSDTEEPATLATITAYGHGAITHPVNFYITAMWDQEGGFLYDEFGNVRKEWTARNMAEKITVKVSEMITVRLVTLTSGVVIFKCNRETVKLFYAGMVKPSSGSQSDTPQTRSASSDSYGTRKSKSGSSTDPDESVGRIQGNAGIEAKKLQHKTQVTLADWLSYYCLYVGIQCQDRERMVEAAQAPKFRTKKDSLMTSILASKETHEAADQETDVPHWWDECLEDHKQLSMDFLETPDLEGRMSKKDLPVTQVGPIIIRGNIEPDSVVLATHTPFHTPIGTSPGYVSSFAPSIPLTVCPALLRAALMGESGARRCRCSPTTMPVVTDLEFDTLIMGQPPRSQQILVVWVTLPQKTGVRDPLQNLYRKMNKHRTMPCTQCQIDSYRLLRYETLGRREGRVLGPKNLLLKWRHNAAPGMILMFLKGNLLYMNFLSGTDKNLAKELLKQVSLSKRNQRLDICLQPDFRFSSLKKDTATSESRLIMKTVKADYIIF